MSFDFEEDTINFYKDKKTGEINELSKNEKEMIMNALQSISNESLKNLRDLLVKNNINSVQKYQNEYSKIEKYVESLIKKHIEQIQEILNNLEG